MLLWATTANSAMAGASRIMEPSNEPVCSELKWFRVASSTLKPCCLARMLVPPQSGWVCRVCGVCGARAEMEDDVSGSGTKRGRKNGEK